VTSSAGSLEGRRSSSGHRSVLACAVLSPAPRMHPAPTTDVEEPCALAFEWSVALAAETVLEMAVPLVAAATELASECALEVPSDAAEAWLLATAEAGEPCEFEVATALAVAEAVAVARDDRSLRVTARGMMRARGLSSESRNAQLTLCS
jgi:hypothetical protein